MNKQCNYHSSCMRSGILCPGCSYNICRTHMDKHWINIHPEYECCLCFSKIPHTSHTCALCEKVAYKLCTFQCCSKLKQFCAHHLTNYHHTCFECGVYHKYRYKLEFCNRCKHFICKSHISAHNKEVHKIFQCICGVDASGKCFYCFKSVCNNCRIKHVRDDHNTCIHIGGIIPIECRICLYKGCEQCYAEHIKIHTSFSNYIMCDLIRNIILELNKSDSSYFKTIPSEICILISQYVYTPKLNKK